MRTHLVLVGFGLLGGLALIAVLAVTAGAQPAQPRVVQGGDGALYLVQGSNAWPLVPDPIDDAELAALNLGSEVDGTLPATVLTAAAPEPRIIAVPPAAAQPPIVQAPPPAQGPPPVTPPGRAKSSAAGPTPTPAALSK